MRRITAIVRTSKLDDVMEALERIQVSGMTVTEVRGHGRQKGHTAVYRGQEYEVTSLPKMQIDVVVAEDTLDSAVRALIAAARTGEIRDGRVFVTPTPREQHHGCRDGERGRIRATRRSRLSTSGGAWRDRPPVQGVCEEPV